MFHTDQVFLVFIRMSLARPFILTGKVSTYRLTIYIEHLVVISNMIAR